MEAIGNFLIDFETLGHLSDFNNFDDLKSAHRQWVQSELFDGNAKREEMNLSGLLFLIPDKPNHPCLDFLFRRHKGHFYRKRYPAISLPHISDKTKE
jgi:hypothetical protein